MTNKITLLQSFLPLIVLISLLAFNILAQDGVWLGDYSNQYILLFSGFAAFLLGIKLNVRFKKILAEVIENLKSVIVPILILVLVGALAGSWLVSGIIPAMVFYGLQILSPDIFLPACVLISAVISVATGSSWTTTATVGIALIAIGSAMGISVGMIAGAVISGAYFGDKMSPLSDTTNLAPAMAGTDLFTHIKYMSYTTIPSIVITLVVFIILSLFITPSGEASVQELLAGIQEVFYISPLLFLVPGVVIAMILMKLKPLLALSAGVVLATIFAFVFQPNVIDALGNNVTEVTFNFLASKTAIVTPVAELNELFIAKGMWGMHGTIFLIVSAMVFGGIMDGIGALSKITFELLRISTSIFGLFASTVASCLGLNAIASDQYLAIVIPGKMFRQAYEDRGLAPENLSRTLEDSGTVTSVLVPWNTCGAYQSATLGVGVGEFFVYAVFNWLSPFVTLFFAYFRIKIRRIGNSIH